MNGPRVNDEERAKLFWRGRLPNKPPVRDEQTRRIQENWNAALEDGLENYNSFELEDIFEDRDLAEFL